MHFDCPACRLKVAIGSEHVGKRGQCPRCGNQFTIPSASDLRAESVVPDQRIDGQKRERLQQQAGDPASQRTPVSQTRPSTGEDEYRLQPLELPMIAPQELPSPTTQITTTGCVARRPSPAKSPAIVMVKDVTKGGAIGACVGLLSLCSGCLVGAMFFGSNADATGASATLGVVIMFGLWLAGPIVFGLAVRGTGARIRIWNETRESVCLEITNTIALIPTNSRELRVTAKDILYLRMSHFYPQHDAASVDLVFIVVLVLLFATCIIPGLIFWATWALQRRHAESAHKTKRISLELVQVPKMISVPILNVIANDVTSLRFDTPKDIEAVLCEIKRRIGIREVRE